jgi:hypothetical protein
VTASFAATFVRQVVTCAVVLLMSGCQSLANAKLVLPPGWVGLESVAPDLRVEASATLAERTQVLQMRDAARARLVQVLGGVQSEPVHVVCFTAACYQRFGGGLPRAKSFGSLRTLLGPDGLTSAYLVHEWWHAELHLRLGFWRWRQLPRWFDEGAAVWVSDDERYGEAMYERVLAQGILPPSLAELRSFDDFIAAIGRHGDHLWRGKPTDAVTVVYPTAAHEVRRWLAAAGPGALTTLVDGLARGADFDTLYRALEHAPASTPRATP